VTATDARKGERREAGTLPVAQVAVDVPLPHLDRPFDYLVPEELADQAMPGVRVRVRFAGRQVDGVLLDRLERSAHEGRLGWLERVVSPEPVLSAELAALCRAVADRYGGTFADVLRLALPPRHARVEAEPVPEPEAEPAAPDRVPEADGGTGPEADGEPVPAADDGTEPAADGWGRYPDGAALLRALRGGRAAHAVWQPLPGEDWPARLAEVAAATVHAGRGALLVMPDQRDLGRVAAACRALLGESVVATLSADLGPARRYRSWLAVRRGHARVVVGTRAAMFAPVADPGLLVIWDDGDDTHEEPRAPYPHARDVLVHRAHATGAALLVAGHTRTAEAQLLVESGWAREVIAARDVLREAVPRVVPVAETEGALVDDPAARAARLPRIGFDAARAALGRGEPVLVQVPRSGYVPGLACGRCREPARCRRCAGPLGLPRQRREPGHQPESMELTGAPRCRWCGVAEPTYRCAHCGSRGLRATTVGAVRTAEELGRAFPGATVRGSGGGVEVLDSVPAKPALVVATPGAEPWVSGAPGGAGYGAALLLDGWALLNRPDLRATEEALRRWTAAAALVRSWRDGGRVVVAADAQLAAVRALVRWDPAGFAAAELAERTELGFPPAVRMAAVDGDPEAVADVLAAARLPGSAEVLGPVELDPGPEGAPRERALVRVRRAEGRALAAALAAAQATRSARKAAEPARLRLDPREIA
jgi:primosomal protein N' (replication factor Y) (superfamily II helicase)